MCKAANVTAANLMAAIEPTLKNLLKFAGVDPIVSTTVFTEYDTALAAIQAWAPGTAAEDILELLEAFDAGFNALPVPATFKDLANIILAGITTVIGVIQANSPAPVIGNAPGPSEAATPEGIMGHYQADVAAATSAKVTLLVPGFKRSIWHTPESQYKQAWNKQVDASGLDAGLKVA